MKAYVQIKFFYIRKTAILRSIVTNSVIESEEVEDRVIFVLPKGFID